MLLLPTLDQDTHTYTLGDQMIPCVSEIISPLTDFSMIPPAVLEYKTMIGIHVHKACELYDLDDLVIDTLDPALKQYVMAWIRFLDETGFVVELNEQIVFHDKYLFAGTLDRVGLLHGVRALVDLKTVAQLGPQTGVQTAAYLCALNHKKKKADHVTKRFALQLKKDGSYRLQPYEDRLDLGTFTSLLNLHNWRIKHHGKANTSEVQH